MSGWALSLQQAPWFWSQPAQRWLWLSLGGLGFVCAGLWLGEDATALQWQAQQEQYNQALQTIQSLQAKTQTAQQAMVRDAPKLKPVATTSLLGFMQTAKTMALDAGLQMPVMAMDTVSTQTRLKFDIRGRDADVWRWWQQAQVISSALVLQRLEVEGGVAQVQMTGVWHWSPVGGSGAAMAVSALELDRHLGVAQHIGFDHALWLQAQRWQAQQRPSYVQWVVPEVKRQPQVLEQFALHHLRYEGVISRADKHRALVRVLDPAAALHPLVLLAEGTYLGQNFGRLQTITPEYLLVRELARDAQGDWAPRWVKLPLGGVVQTPPSAKEASAS